jgi:endogenous inhibitor of DNA gyrase (YacG/DUF329 family)
MSDEPLCVYCRQRPAESPWRPFCSERCKLADLGRWLGGHYRVAGTAASGPEADAADEASEDGDERTGRR